MKNSLKFNGKYYDGILDSRFPAPKTWYAEYAFVNGLISEAQYEFLNMHDENISIYEDHLDENDEEIILIQFRLYQFDYHQKRLRKLRVDLGQEFDVVSCKWIGDPSSSQLIVAKVSSRVGGIRCTYTVDFDDCSFKASSTEHIELFKDFMFQFGKDEWVFGSTRMNGGTYTNYEVIKTTNTCTYRSITTRFTKDK